MKIKILSRGGALVLALTIMTAGAGAVSAQTKSKKAAKPAAKSVGKSVAAPKVTQIDAAQLKKILQPSGKPLLVNFWATWCDPCREEFPDLVKIGVEYQGKIDAVTVSMDELSEINRDVPIFLAEMKSTFPAYLLKVPDEGEAIALVAKDWQGGLPFTVLYDANGAIVYSKQGKFNVADLRAALAKSIVK